MSKKSRDVEKIQLGMLGVPDGPVGVKGEADTMSFEDARELLGEFCTMGRCAEILGVSRQRVHQLMRDGRVRSVVVDRLHRVYSVADAERYAAARLA